MTTVNDVCLFLQSIAPPEMKMDFDNVGLLVGRGGASVSRILVALDITSDVIAEAREMGAELIVSHHPLFFSAKSVTDADVTGGKILSLAESGIAAICMHTNLDAAERGVSEMLAATAGLYDIAPLTEDGKLPDGEPFSYGRYGHLSEPTKLHDYLGTLKTALKSYGLRYYDAGKAVHKVAAVGGSGGSYLQDALRLGCDTLVTADVKYDVFLDARELGINLIDADHFCTENVVVAPLVDRLGEQFADIAVRISEWHGQTAKFF